MTWTLRPAKPADAVEVAAILSDWIDTTPWMPRLHTHAEDRGFVAGLIDKGLVTVGVGSTGIAGFMAQDGAWIPALYLAPSARRRGLGRALIEHARAQAPRLQLWTFAANQPAQAFYTAQGFREARRSDGDNDEALPDILYVRDKDD